MQKYGMNSKKGVQTMRRIDWRRGVRVFVAGALTYATYIFAEESGAQPALTKVRQASLDAFTMEVEIERPTSVLRPSQGNMTLVMRVTVDSGVTAIVWKASKLPTPKFFPLGTNGYEGIDYDSDGNLILWMGSEGATMYGQNIHEEYSENTQFFVAPSGTVVHQGSGATLDRYLSSNTNTPGMANLRTIRWALGRPPAEDLNELETEGSNPDGTRALRVSGQNSSYSGPGVWSLVIDPANGHLVRQASFGGRGLEPRSKWLSEGTRWFGNIAIAQRGEYIYDPPLSQHIEVRLLSFKPVLDPDVVAEARKIISKAQARRVQVYDYRDDSSHPNVKLYQVGELDKEK